jgi:hypothetical protein
VLGELQGFFGAFEDDLRESEAEGVVGFFEDSTCGWELIVEGLAHADGLRTLAGKEECEFCFGIHHK